MSAYVPTVRDEWGLACPGCGTDDHLEVELTVLAVLTPDGTVPNDDCHDWGDRSYMRCDKCGRDGRVQNFKIDQNRATSTDIQQQPKEIS